MALLGDETTPINDQELNRQPSQQAIDTLKKVINIQGNLNLDFNCCYFLVYID